MSATPTATVSRCGIPHVISMTTILMVRRSPATPHRGRCCAYKSAWICVRLVPVPRRPGPRTSASSATPLPSTPPIDSRCSTSPSRPSRSSASSRCASRRRTARQASRSPPQRTRSATRSSSSCRVNTMARIRREERDEIELAKCEIDRLTLHLHLAGGQVYRELAEVEVSGAMCVRRRMARTRATSVQSIRSVVTYHRADSPQPRTESGHCERSAQRRSRHESLPRCCQEVTCSPARTARTAVRCPAVRCRYRADVRSSGFQPRHDDRTRRPRCRPGRAARGRITRCRKARNRASVVRAGREGDRERSARGSRDHDVRRRGR